MKARRLRASLITVALAAASVVAVQAPASAVSCTPNVAYGGYYVYVQNRAADLCALVQAAINIKVSSTYTYTSFGPQSSTFSAATSNGTGYPAAGGLARAKPALTWASWKPITASGIVSFTRPT